MQPTADTSQAALGQLQQAESTAQNPNDILSSQRQQLGVPGAQNTVTGLRGAIDQTSNLLKQVAPSVMGRTQNSLVTSAQAGRIIGNEQAPIQQNLSDQSTKYNQANQDLSTLEGQAKDAASGIYAGQQDKMSYLQNLYNSLYKKEQDAATLAEQQRQFNLTPHGSGGSGSGGLDLSSLFGDAAAPAAPNVQDQAYASVQKFLQGNDNQIKSDYAATLKSANYGNALDKLKVQLYQQSRPDLFGTKPATPVGIGNTTIKGIAAGAKK